MTDITIPPEALEAAAIELASKLGRFTVEGSGPYVKVARAVCVAMLKAWPGALIIPECDGVYMSLPLPMENSND